MVKLLQWGIYSLIETKAHTKILILDNKKMYAWIIAGEIGEILVASHKPHKIDHILSVGKYRIYKVKNESKLTDLTHLELLVGDGVWQGYLLTSGLPSANNKKKVRIIPAKEIITKSTG